MEKVNLNDNIENIEAFAFNSCYNLNLTSLPKSLKNIGPSAFIACTNIKITSLPESLTGLGSSAFSGCPNVKISTFGGKLRVIGQQCFKEAGNGNEGAPVEEIIINYSVEKIEDDAFKGYATSTLQKVYFARSDENTLDAYGKTTSQMGFSSDLIFGQLQN